MEHTGRYYEVLAHQLSEADIFVSTINPKLIKDFDNDSLRKVKSDKADAVKIARYALDKWQNLKQYSVMDELRNQLKTMNRQFGFYMKHKTAMKNNLIGILDQTYPGVNTYFDSPARSDGSQKWVDFASTYWHVDCVRKMSLNDITVELLYPEWLEYKKLHTTADTYITRLNSDWKSFYEGTSIIQTPICKLNKLTLDIWAHKLIKEHHMTRKKYTNMQTIMRQVLAYANDLGLISNNPMNSVKIEKGMFVKSQKKPNTTQVLSPSEKAEIIELAWADFRNSVKFYELSPLALIFQFYTGLRLGELCCVRYEDIEEDNYIHIQRMIRRESKEVVPHTKTDCGDRKVYLTPAAKHIIATARERQQTLHVDSNGYIFSINGLPLTERSIADLLRKYSKKLGIVHKSSHKVRKTYGSNLLNNGVSIDTTRLMLGHSDERTTLAYYCYDTNEDAENRKLFEKALQ